MISKERLKAIPPFTSFSDEELARAAEYMVEKFFPSGEPMIRDKVIGEGIYFIVSGKVDIIKGGLGKEDAVIAQLGPGTHVGEMALIDNKPTTARVLASERTTTYFLDRIKYRSLVDNHPTVAVKLLDHFCKSFCQRMRATNDLLIQEKQMNKQLAARLAVH